MTQLDLGAPARLPLVRGLDPGARPLAPAPPARDRRRALPLAGVLTLLGVLLLAGITRYPGLGSDDEGTYAAQAWAVLTHGDLAHYTYWYDHPPLGWLQLAALDLLSGPLRTATSVTDARLLVVLPSLVTLALVHVLARRVGARPAAALAAVLLLGLSPLGLTYLRTAHLDTLALPWLLGAFALAATPRRNLWAYAGSGACFAVAVLTKETVLLVLPALALQVWQTCDRRTRAFCVTAFTVVLGSVSLVYPLYAVLKGELVPGPDHVSLLGALAFQLGGRQGTGSLFDPASAAHALVAGWVALDPWLLAAGVVLVPAGLAVRRLRPLAIAALLIVVFALRPGYLPGMYVTVLLPFAALLAAGLLDAAVGPLQGRVRGPALLRPAAALSVAVVVLALLTPTWARGLVRATTSDELRSYRQTVAFLQGTVRPDDRVLVDDTLYVDLMDRGLTPRTGAVWFFKLDRASNADPGILDEVSSWRVFDYVVSSPVVRSTLDSQGGLQETRDALANSRVVRTFGTGPDRYEVRQVLPQGLPGAS